jgi:hypothetical protein
MTEPLHMSVETVPMYRIGRFDFTRIFDPELVARIAGDYQALTAFEEEFERQARREAASRSLTVLQVASPVKWRDYDNRRLLQISFDVRHEPQADDKLIYDVYIRLSQDRSLWALGAVDNIKIARAAVEAVRDLGRLTASVPRPESIPE